MEFLSAIPVIGAPLAVILPFLVVLGIVVFVHEYGHYIVGRWCGIRSEVFSIGFGPKLFGWTDRRGTHWQVAALPLGGYVRFVGDMDPASAGRVDDAELSPAERKAAFHNAGLLARAATVAAGPAFNFALSFVLFVALGLAVGKQSNEPVVGGIRAEVAEIMELEPGDRVLAVDGTPVTSFVEITDAIRRANGEAVPVEVERGGDRLTVTVAYRMAPEVDLVTPGMPASRAGMVPGDRILAVDGTPIATFYDLQVVTSDKPLGQEITVEVEREGERMAFTMMPEQMERRHPVTGELAVLPTVGISAHGLGGIDPVMENASVGEALWAGVTNTWGIIAGTVNYVGDLVFAGADPSQLGGPIRIAQISGERAEQGLLDFVHLIAVISTSIGFINLFPIPVLDGGHLMFYLFEALRGKPAGEKAIRFGTMIGLSLVLLLMVFATYNDLVRL